tara:strand:- start:1403 stop:1579 length:177 start_codon:yes stop_codon:yes gene_type:complete
MHAATWRLRRLLRITLGDGVRSSIGDAAARENAEPGIMCVPLVPRRIVNDPALASSNK